MREFGGLSRLVSAAVVNQEFCSLLLSNPAVALASGFNGERFQLASHEEQLVLSIQATTLVDFARQIATGQSRVPQPYR
jgi:hypothetical protein